jgi:transposase
MSGLFSLLFLHFFKGFGVEGVEAALTGRPSYHPEVMPKIYIYG